MTVTWVQLCSPVVVPACHLTEFSEYFSPSLACLPQGRFCDSFMFYYKPITFGHPLRVAVE